MGARREWEKPPATPLIFHACRVPKDPALRRQAGQDEQDVGEPDAIEAEESPHIATPHAVAHPGTVVVHPFDADAAVFAVSGGRAGVEATNAAVLPAGQRGRDGARDEARIETGGA